MTQIDTNEYICFSNQNQSLHNNSQIICLFLIWKFELMNFTMILLNSKILIKQ